MEEQCFSEADSYSASQEIARILTEPEVNCRVDRSTQLVPILSQINPVHTVPCYFALTPQALQNNFNITRVYYILIP